MKLYQFGYLRTFFFNTFFKECVLDTKIVKEAFDLWGNKKIFKVSDSPFSYRHINYLNENKVFPDNRKNKRGWRKLSAIDLVFLAFIKKLGDLGLDRDYLIPIRKMFYGRNNIDVKFGMSMALFGYKMYLVLNGKTKKSFIYDFMALNFELEETTESSNPYIIISLNEILRTIDLFKKRVPEKNRFSNLRLIASFIDEAGKELTEDEIRILDILRAKNYQSIKIRNNKNNYLIDIEKKKENIEDNNFSDEDIFRRIKEVRDKGFGKIEFNIKDKKFVNVKEEERKKI